MHWLSNPEMLARVQFGVNAMFHILWPPLTIGLALVLLGTELAWVRTHEPFYYHQTRFWTRVFLINFAVGVVTGIPMEFAFGTNWAPLAATSGDFMGNILGFETAMAFMLEAGFLGIMLFGWRRVGPKMHLFATGMVAFGSSLSAFWIMVANSWMQTPTGVKLAGGKFLVTDWWRAVFNPDLRFGFGHMYMACIELSLVVIAGISAYYLHAGRHRRFFLPAFRYAVAALVVAAPLQMIIGDSAGSALEQTQPAKLAAIEADWTTNAPGTSADWALLAWPDRIAQKNDWEISIPHTLSLVVTHTRDGEVKGLKDFKPDDQPPIAVPFYAFRIMVAAGLFVALLAFWTLWRMWRRPESMDTARIGENKWLLRGWMAAIPAIYVAMEAGWLTREVGRQPWVVYGLMRTSEGVSHLPYQTVLWSLLMYLLFYALIGFSALKFMVLTLRRGPTFDPPPSLQLDPGKRSMHASTTGGY